jgi:NAD(P)-dependent dehydrogenase (short-subunit alcohol dehydrogenase family)
VNNAAIWIPDTTVETVSLDDWNRTIAVNLTGAVLMSKYAIPLMRKQGVSIIHMASQLGHVGKAGRSWYSTAKAGLIQLAKAMAIDHAADGIRVNTLSPGAIETGRLLMRFPTMAAARAAIGPKHVLNRLGLPDEIAAAAVFLASDAASFMTGSDMLVDGGYTAT